MIIKKTTLLSLMLFVCLVINAEPKANGKPFLKNVPKLKSLNYLNDPAVLTAELINFKRTSVLMIHNNKRNEEVTDTLSFTNGRFTIPVSLIPEPRIVSLYIIVNGRFHEIKAMLVPGYQLLLKTDVNKWARRNMEIDWDSQGSVINNFYTEINKHPQYYDPTGKVTFDNWYRNSKITTDSLLIKCTALSNDAMIPTILTLKI